MDETRDRNAALQGFLSRAGWSAAARQPLAGDASSRRYERLTRPSGEQAILMDASSEDRDSLERFIRIAGHLSEAGLSAPRILAEDRDAGLLVIEDFGDRVFARVIARDPAQERPLYETAVDVLTRLHRIDPPPGLSAPGPAQLAAFAAIVCDDYADRPGMAPTLGQSLARHLAAVAEGPSVLSLRDYHSENLIWLPDRQGLRRAGLLDFQDAFLCHPAYDLVSLLHDARRDVPAGMVEMMTDRYLSSSPIPPEPFRLAFAVLVAQRNLRILAIFARLCLQRAKPHYLDMMPRVWSHLVTGLAHPALVELRQTVLDIVPPPDAEFRKALLTRCTTTRQR